MSAQEVSRNAQIARDRATELFTELLPRERDAGGYVRPHTLRDVIAGLVLISQQLAAIATILERKE